jgi:16S rRNA (guanine527-N7)-methyltransferase
VQPEAGPPDPSSVDPHAPAVEVLFGDRAPLARRFAVHLSTSAVERGLIGPREVPRIWDRHILNCAAIHPLLPHGAAVADVGSGAGLPGIAVAIARADLRVTLVEPLQRRVVWAQEVVEDLELRNVVVRRARAEELVGDLLVEVVTARAVAPLTQLARWCLPLVQPGGELIAVKGRSAQQEAQAADAELRAVGASSWSLATCGDGVLDVPTTVVRVTRGAVPARRDVSRKRGRGDSARGGHSSTGGQVGRSKGRR